MKKNYTLFSVFIAMLLLNFQTTLAQTTEDFEDEIAGTTIFTDNAQIFNITSLSTDSYDIHDNTNGGWNGTVTDNKFVDNFDFMDVNNVSSFSISTADETDIIISSLYLFCSTSTLANPMTGTLTIEGFKAGALMYTITKNSGFANVETYTPNSGYTFIDFATEGAADYSNTDIDELVFTSDGDIDYMGLDAFTWDFSTLSIGENQLKNQLSVYPNPASNHIRVSNLTSTVEYKIFDILGKNIQKGKITENGSIAIQNLKRGLYILQLNTGNSFKFVKN